MRGGELEAAMASASGKRRRPSSIFTEEDEELMVHALSLSKRARTSCVVDTVWCCCMPLLRLELTLGAL